MAQVKKSSDPFIVVGDKQWCVGCKVNNGVTLEIDDADQHEKDHVAIVAAEAVAPTPKAAKH